MAVYKWLYCFAIEVGFGANVFFGSDRIQGRGEVGPLLHCPKQFLIINPAYIRESPM
jgi:hypothetical protein